MATSISGLAPPFPQHETRPNGGTAAEQPRRVQAQAGEPRQRRQHRDNGRGQRPRASQVFCAGQRRPVLALSAGQGCGPSPWSGNTAARVAMIARST